VLNARRNSSLPLHIAGCIGLATASLLIVWGHRWGAYPVVLWIVAMMVAACALAWAFTRDRAPSAAHVIAWALVLRVITLWTTPYFEDDYFRYLWDGYRTLTDGNPYLFAPSHFFSANSSTTTDAMPAAVAHTLSGVNNPDINTIYGPALQWLFALSAAIAPGELWPIRVMWLAVDMLAVCMLVKIVGAQRAMLYALCPLVLHEIGGAAHPDGLIGALLLFAYCAAWRRQLVLAGVLIGCAAAMKVHALLALPFLLIGANSISFAAIARCSAACALTYVTFWLPFIFTADAFAQAWRSFATFARDWQFNALGFALIQSLSDSFFARIASALVMLSLWSAIAIRLLCKLRHKRASAKEALAASAIVMAFGALLFFSPVINAWYLLWLLPLAVFTRWISPWAVAFVLPLSYATEFNLGNSTTPYNLPVWVTAIEWCMVLLALGFDVLKARNLMLIQLICVWCPASTEVWLQSAGRTNLKRPSRP
jgi:alpha-1,6-mannosyltransferase